MPSDFVVSPQTLRWLNDESSAHTPKVNKLGVGHRHLKPDDHLLVLGPRSERRSVGLDEMNMRCHAQEMLQSRRESGLELLAIRSLVYRILQQRRHEALSSEQPRASKLVLYNAMQLTTKPHLAS